MAYPLVETALIEWFHAYQNRINMSGDLLKEKGAQFLSQLYPEAESFEFSNGWIDSFKRRHGIRNFRRFGESGAVDMEVLANELPMIREKLASYQPNDIYNMDETGLFYRMQADSSLATMLLEGRKTRKERLTIVICANADGTDRRPLMVIGTAIKPRCFKNVKLEGLGIQYHANKSAWMTRNLFHSWLRKFDANMAGRKVLLIMDNCPAHSKLDDPEFPILCNTEVFYFPPNTTSKIQPCDAGIIKSFKTHYRRLFNRKLLQKIEQGSDENVNVLDGIQLAISAWEAVSPTTIANCFRHCGIMGEGVTDDRLEEPELDPDVLGEIQNQIQQLQYKDPMNISEFVSPEGENLSLELISEDQIIANLSSLSANATEQDTEDDSVEIPIISDREAENALQIVERYLLQQDSDHFKDLKAIRSIRNSVAGCRVRKLQQTSIHRYFHNQQL